MLSRKVLSLTKPKGKIYKTKSLGHFITVLAYLSWIHSAEKMSRLASFAVVRSRHLAGETVVGSWGLGLNVSGFMISKVIVSKDKMRAYTVYIFPLIVYQLFVLSLLMACLLALCSTMGVGCQSRRFNCLFWRETRQRILGHEISPYPEVVRGGEWELTTRPSGDQQKSWWQETKGELVVGQEQRQLAWIHGGAVNTRHRAERRGGKIGSSEEESQDVWSQ